MKNEKYYKMRCFKLKKLCSRYDSKHISELIDKDIEFEMNKLTKKTSVGIPLQQIIVL